jgi:peptidoglycan/LPS O-acetylase OafA/YrhL
MRDYLSKNIKIRYRPEIDSLRAISVIAVIIYHAKINFFGSQLFAGGYLGVDIFFVISGYLITSIILKELQQKKSFSFRNFYLRRARRILPALFFLVFCCIPASWLILMPSSFVDFSKSVYFSLGFSSNFYFYFTGLEYGAINGLLKPLLHTWSLAVEEQYYILFPILLVLGFLFFKKRINIVILSLLLLSLIFAEFFSLKNSNLNFYILPSRAWELLAGSALVILESKRNFKPSDLTSNIFCLMGLGLIFFSFIYFYEPVPSPSIKNTVPIIGTLLILIFINKKTLVTRLLNNTLFTGLGLISYSLYLWHYPIFSFVRNLRAAQGIVEYSLTGILIFLISIISYFFIEKPFRDKKFISNKVFIKIVIISLSLLILSSFIIIKNKGFKNRFPNYDSLSTDYYKYLTEVRIKKYELGNPQFIDSKKKNILIIGNSHARNTFNALKLNENLFNTLEFSILDLSIDCVENIFIKFEFCDEVKMTKLQKKIFNDSEVIILSTRFREVDINSLEKIIHLTRKFKKQIVLTTKNPSFYFENYLTFLDKFYIENKRLPNAEETIILEKKYFRSMNEKDKILNKRIEDISINLNVRLLKKIDLFCDKKTERCVFLTKNNDKILFDADHYSLNGAKYIGKKIFYLNWLGLN